LDDGILEMVNRYKGDLFLISKEKIPINFWILPKPFLYPSETVSSLQRLNPSLNKIRP